MNLFGHAVPTKVVASVAAGVVVIAGAGAGYYYYNNSVNSYNESSKAFDIALADYKDILGAKEVSAAKGIKADEVSDKAVYTTFNDDIKVEYKKVTPAGWSGYSEAAHKNNASVDDMKAQGTKIGADVTALNTSKAHKQLANSVVRADKALEESKGHVADGDKTRDTLSKTVESAKKALKDSSSTMKTFDAKRSTLESQIKDVKKAVADKSKADADAKAAADAAKAAEEAAKAQAGAPAPAPATGGYSGGSNGSTGKSYGYSFSRNRGRSYGYGAPAPRRGGSAPAPAPAPAPHRGGNGGGSNDRGNPTYGGSLDGSDAHGYCTPTTCHSWVDINIGG